MKINATISTYLLELFFPRQCAGCGVFDEDLCASCVTKFELSLFSCIFCGRENNDGRTCARCKNYFFLDGLCSSASYHDPLTQKIITAFKYRNHRAIAISLAELMRGSVPPGDNLLALPLAAARLRARGYNQAELLARELGKLTSLPLMNQSLFLKIRATPQQAKAKSREKRFEQIKNAFALTDSSVIASKRVILVDDVATSGATLNEAARVLKNGGAFSVWGWVFAHG